MTLSCNENYWLNGTYIITVITSWISFIYLIAVIIGNITKLETNHNYCDDHICNIPILLISLLGILSSVLYSIQKMMKPNSML